MKSCRAFGMRFANFSSDMSTSRSAAAWILSGHFTCLMLGGVLRFQHVAG